MLAKAAYVQMLRADAGDGRGHAGGRRPMARAATNTTRASPDAMAEIPKGIIYDRNGLPLATGNWDELEKHRADYQQLGIDLDRACPRTESRHYPFGPLLFDLLGDVRTRQRWGAGNTSFVERDSARRLRGYDDRATVVAVKNPKTQAMERVAR